MQKLLKLCLIAAGAAALIAIESVAPPDLCAAGRQSFSEDILPGYHEAGGEGLQKSGLDLTTYHGIMKGIKFGNMVIPGDAASSKLMLLIDWRAAPQLRMPHSKKQLSSCDCDAIRARINEGTKNN